MFDECPREHYANNVEAKIKCLFKFKNVKYFFLLKLIVTKFLRPMYKLAMERSAVRTLAADYCIVKRRILNESSKFCLISTLANVISITFKLALVLLNFEKYTFL